jgi:hypothetical protein
VTQPASTGAARCAARQATLFVTSPDRSYGPHQPEVNRPHKPAPISPTVPPLTAEDVALWDAWTDVDVRGLNFDAFDDDGYPLAEGGF